MYESYYSFTAEPFRLTPDHRMCFVHPSYQRAKTYMEYALRRREGFIMITGTPGTGKTTLINDLLHNLPKEKLVIAKLDSIHLEGEELLRMVAFSFGLEGEKLDKTALVRNMTHFLTEKSKEGKKGLLIVDEGQALSSSALEELRLLSNIHDNEGALLQVFLAGQEKLLDVVRSPSMAQLHQRLIAACHLDPLSVDQTEAYIKHRLRTVGWKVDPELHEDIFSLIHKFSLGIPRRINLICSRLLLSGFIQGKHTLRIEDVQHSIEELREENLAPTNDEQVSEPVKLPVDNKQVFTPFQLTGSIEKQGRLMGETIPKWIVFSLLTLGVFASISTSWMLLPPESLRDVRTFRSSPQESASSKLAFPAEVTMELERLAEANRTDQMMQEEKAQHTVTDTIEPRAARESMKNHTKLVPIYSSDQ